MRICVAKVMTAVILSAGPVVAQSYEMEQRTPEAKSVAMAWLIGAIFLVGCLVVAFKPAKRANLR